MENKSFSSNRTSCPECGAKRAFAEYDDGSGGYCHSCGKTVMYNSTKKQGKQMKKQQEKSQLLQTITLEQFNELRSCDDSNFNEYFGELFGDAFNKHCNDNYFLRADDYGATIFTFIDSQGFIRNLKSMAYKQDGHRDKVGFVLKIKEKETTIPVFYGYRYAKKGKYDMIKSTSVKKHYSQCLFGEYYLNSHNYMIVGDRTYKYDDKTPVILLESEKSVLISSFHYPSVIFLATGGTNGLTEEKAEILKDRIVYIMFDNEEKAQLRAEKAKIVLTGIAKSVDIIDIFKNYKVEEGYDLADILEQQAILRGEQKDDK